MILVLAVVGFFAIVILGILYIPRTLLAFSAVYFFNVLGLAVATKEAVLPMVLILVLLIIGAVVLDLHKIKANPFKKD